MASIDSRIARTINGKAMTAAARAAPVQRKAKTMPNQSCSAAPIGPRRPNVSSSIYYDSRVGKVERRSVDFRWEITAHSPGVIEIPSFFVTVDGHKWLNVPYDSGYAFVRDYALMAKAFRYSADYLPSEDRERPTPGAIGPESSRRARSFAVWATLQAYGRQGQQRIVEHCLDLAQHFGEQVRLHPQLELLNEVQLNIVAFRYNPGGLDEAALNALNQRLGQAVIDDGRFLVGTSRIGSTTVFRPAFSNWRTRFADVEDFAKVVVEVAAGLGNTATGS